MSARASGYMKGLAVCPNGELITPREKLVAMVLADSHQDYAGRFTYPAVETIALESMTEKRTCLRYLDALERKGVIRRLRPASQGRGMNVFYSFPALDAVPDGWHSASGSTAKPRAKKKNGKEAGCHPLFGEKGGERVGKGWAKGGETGASLNGMRAREQELEQEQEQVQVPPQPPQAGELGFGAKSASGTGTAGSGGGTGETQIPLGKDKSKVAGAKGDARIPFGKDEAKERAIELAVDALMQGLGVSNRRKRRIFRDAVAMEADKGESPPSVVLAMLAAWRAQEQASARGELSAKYGVEKFIGNGVWKSERRWHWDEEKLKRQAKARFG